MKYRSTSSQIIEAASAQELVRQLAAGTDEWEWMEDAAKRAWIQTGRPVRFGTHEEFVEDLLAAGLITMEN
jgi:hypothetical protein